MQIPRVFIGSSTESLKLAYAIQSNLGHLEARVWDQGLLRAGNFILDELLSLSKSFDYAVFILSKDDKIISRGKPLFSPRDNVIFEAGLFYGAIGKDRIFLLRPSEGSKLPSDVSGLINLTYRIPDDGNYRAAFAPACQEIIEKIEKIGVRQDRATNDLPSGMTFYKNLKEAKNDLKNDCYNADTIAILGNRGLLLFGIDQSIISKAEIDKYRKLRKLRLVLLSPESRWIHEGLIQLREHESINEFKDELEHSHQVIELTMGKFFRKIISTKSGVRYHRGEPNFRLLITDQSAYVSSYATPPAYQSRDLPVYKFDKSPGSLYFAYKRFFDDLWHNHSLHGSFQKTTFDFHNSGCGIVVAKDGLKTYAALLRRDDGFWVLPKGQKLITEESHEATVIREVSKGMGLKSENLRIEEYLGSYALDETNKIEEVSKIVHIYLIICTMPHLPSLKAIDYAEAIWWDMSKSLPQMLYPYQKNYLQNIVDKLQSQNTIGHFSF